MKESVFICLLLFSHFIASTQQEPVTKSFTKEDYLLKSKKQKKGAVVLIIGGSTLVAIGAAISLGEAFRENVEYTSTGDVVMIIGGTAMVASIPLFIAASRNKKKALSVSFRNESVPFFYKGTLTKKYLPSLCLKMNL